MKRIVSIILLLSLLLAACGQTGNDTAGGYTFTDDLGRTVTVDNPQRVACLLGSYADVWYLAGGEVIAAPDDAWDDFELPLSQDAVVLGSAKNLSLELLLDCAPDFVIASTNTQFHLDWQDTLEAAGIDVAYFDVADFDDYLRMLKVCTDITGRTDLYEQNGLAVQKQIQEVTAAAQERVAQSGAPSVLYLRISASGIYVKNSEGNVLGEMLRSLGCVNIADSDAVLLENLSMEHILIQDPDFIFLVQQGDDTEGTQKTLNTFIAENPAWQELAAVKEGRVYTLEKRLYSLKPNSLWGDAYEQLEAILAQ